MTGNDVAFYLLMSINLFCIQLNGNLRLVAIIKLSDLLFIEQNKANQS